MSIKYRLLACTLAAVIATAAADSKENFVCKDKFIYFAYGSNLLKDRLRLNNPSAEFVGVGYIQDFRLDFITYANLWKGAVATIAEAPRSEVWGALWKLDCSDLALLDRQEGVHLNWYVVRHVPVISRSGEVVMARTYQQTVEPSNQRPGELVPIVRRPSLTYLKVILNGAIQCGLPKTYVMYLFSIPHNGAEADNKALKSLPNLNSTILYPGNYNSAVSAPKHSSLS